MSDIGGPSRDREIESRVAMEEEPRDIHVIREQLIQREPSPLITVEGQEHVLEFDPEEDSEEIEVDPEEDDDDPEEVPPTPVDAEMYDVLYDRAIELQDRVRDLEELADIRQTAIEQKDEKVGNLEVRLGDVEWKLVHVENEKEELRAENEKMKTEIEELKEKLAKESADRLVAENAWMNSARRAEIAEEGGRARAAKIEEMTYIFHRAIDNAQDRVAQYPIQFEDLPWYLLDRRTMFRIMEEERGKVARRFSLP